MKWMLPSLILPQGVLLPLLTLAGVLMIVGLRQFAGAIIVFVLGMAFLPMFEPIVAALVNLLPDWALWLLLVVCGLIVLQALSAVLIGRNAADQMAGTLAADIVRFLILLPFRGFRAFLRWLINGGP